LCGSDIISTVTISQNGSGTKFAPIFREVRDWKSASGVIERLLNPSTAVQTQSIPVARLKRFHRSDKSEKTVLGLIIMLLLHLSA
jgi:hypothetical protein